MPELPEVETVRRGVAERVVGRRIVSATVTGARTVRRTSADVLVAALTGATPTAARRHGKYLLVDLDSGDTVMIHLRMSGRVLVVPRDAPRPAHTHVVALLDSGEELRFVDPRTFGEVVAFSPTTADALVPELTRLGPDALTITPDELSARLSARRGALKAVLLDQRVVAGIGNIYADEILHRSRLSPVRPACSLRAPALGRLHAAIASVLEAAVAAGGSTLPDTQYVGVDGESGWFQVDHLVYGRAGERCRSCERRRIAAIRVAGRTTCFCPACQR